MATPSSAALLMVFLSSICVPCSHWCSTLGRSILPQLFQFQVIESLLTEKAEWLSFDLSMLFCLFLVCVCMCATLGVVCSEFQFHGHYLLHLISGSNYGAYVLTSKLNNRTLHSMLTSDASSGSFVVSVGTKNLCPGYCLLKFYESLPAYCLSTSYQNGLCWLVYLNAAWVLFSRLLLNLQFYMRGCDIGLLECLPIVNYVIYPWSDSILMSQASQVVNAYCTVFFSVYVLREGIFLIWFLLESYWSGNYWWCQCIARGRIYLLIPVSHKKNLHLHWFILLSQQSGGFLCFWVASMILDGFSFSKKLLVSILQEEPLLLWLIWNLQEALKLSLLCYSFVLVMVSLISYEFLAWGSWLYLLWDYNLPLCIL